MIDDKNWEGEIEKQGREHAFPYQVLRGQPHFLPPYLVNIFHLNFRELFEKQKVQTIHNEKVIVYRNIYENQTSIHNNAKWISFDATYKNERKMQ